MAFGLGSSYITHKDDRGVFLLIAKTNGISYFYVAFIMRVFDENGPSYN